MPLLRKEEGGLATVWQVVLVEARRHGLTSQGKAATLLGLHRSCISDSKLCATVSPPRSQVPSPLARLPTPTIRAGAAFAERDAQATAWSCQVLLKHLLNKPSSSNNSASTPAGCQDQLSFIRTFLLGSGEFSGWGLSWTGRHNFSRDVLARLHMALHAFIAITRVSGKDYHYLFSESEVHGSARLAYVPWICPIMPARQQKYIPPFACLTWRQGLTVRSGMISWDRGVSLGNSWSNHQLVNSNYCHRHLWLLLHQF